MGKRRWLSQLSGELVGEGGEHNDGSNPETWSKHRRIPTRWVMQRRRSEMHKIHKLVAREWVPNPENKRCVDHIDGDRTNNNYENLRHATSAENSMNRKKSSDRSSVYKGVSIYKPTNKWQTFIWINGSNKLLGYYATEREAAEVYNAAAIGFYKEFARVNIFED